MPDFKVSCHRFFPVRRIAEVERPWETPKFGSEAVNSVIVDNPSIDESRVNCSQSSGIDQLQVGSTPRDEVAIISNLAAIVRNDCR